MGHVHQFRERIPRGTAGYARMGIFRSGSKHETCTQKTAQTIGHGGFAFREPDSIRDDAGVWARGSRSVLQPSRKVGTADFLFQFPEKSNVDREALLDRVPRSEQG